MSMTNEQREAIENLSEINNLSKEELQNENITAILDYEDLKSLDTVLSLIKENQKQTDKYKTLYERALSDLVKADKQIELMAKYWNTGLAMCDNCDKIVEKYEENTCKECIKQYFERNSKEGVEYGRYRSKKIRFKIKRRTCSMF